MNVSHVLYAPAKGHCRDEVVRILVDARIEFHLVEWPRAERDRRREDISLVTSVGEFNSLASVKSYVARHRELAGVADRSMQRR